MSEETQVATEAVETQEATDTTQTEAAEQTETALGGQQEQPQEPQEYNVEIEGFDFAAFKEIPQNAELLGRAKEVGLSNEQVSFMLAEYNQLVPTLAQEVAELKAEESISSLKSAWGDKYEANMGNAVKALHAAGFTNEDFNNPAIGNNVELAKLAAHFGAQMKEDAPPANTGSSQENVSDRLRTLMTDPAYRDVNNPNHKSVKSEVESIYAKGGKL